MTAVDESTTPPAEDTTPPTSIPGTALVPAPTRRASLTEKLTYARHLAASGLLPAAYREKPANVLYAIEYGDMLGVATMAAITGIHVIEGKPTASAALMSALVRRAGHRLRISGNDERAVVQIVRFDDPEFTFESVWTLDRARKANLDKKKVWREYPAAMLKARAISECARDACEEVLLGMHYTPEELGEDVDEDGIPTRVKATAERVADINPLDDVDWAAEIPRAEAALNRDKLTELWHRAQVLEPLNENLRKQIEEAGQRVKAIVDAEAAKPAAPETADPDGAVEAEIVDDPAELHRTASRLFDALLACETVEQVDTLARAEILGAPVAHVNVDALLSDDAREALDIREGAYSLGSLAHVLRTYTDRHGMSPQTATLPGVDGFDGYPGADTDLMDEDNR
jgi:hypothetical protein